MKRRFEPTVEILEGRCLLSATTYLQNSENQFTSTTDVYTDGGAAGNHFLYPAEISMPALAMLLPRQSTSIGPVRVARRARFLNRGRQLSSAPSAALATETSEGLSFKTASSMPEQLRRRITLERFPTPA